MNKNKLVLKSKYNTNRYYINFSKTNGKIILGPNSILNPTNYTLNESNNDLTMENNNYEPKDNSSLVKNLKMSTNLFNNTIIENNNHIYPKNAIFISASETTTTTFTTLVPTTTTTTTLVPTTTTTTTLVPTTTTTTLVPTTTTTTLVPTTTTTTLVPTTTTTTTLVPTTTTTTTLVPTTTTTTTLVPTTTTTTTTIVPETTTTTSTTTVIISTFSESIENSISTTTSTTKKELKAELSMINNHTLKLIISGGSPNYNYSFTSTITSGSCVGCFVTNPSEGIISIDGGSTIKIFNYAEISGMNYGISSTVTDSNGNTVESNIISPLICLVPETLITMFDNTTKKLKDIIIGDELLTIDNNKLVMTKVIGKSLHVANETISINNELLESSLSHNHLIRKNGLIEKVNGYNLKLGDKLIDINNNDVIIEKIKLNNSPHDVINISTELGTYIANNILTHNKSECQQI